MSSVQIVSVPALPESSGAIISYRITHNHKSASVLTEFKIQGHKSATAVGSLNVLPQDVRTRIRADIDRLHSIISTLEYRGFDFSANDVADEFNRYLTDYTLYNYIRSLIFHFKRRGKIRTSEPYTSALNSFMQFRRGADIHLRCLTNAIVEEYEDYLNRRGLVPNTISFYMRILRAAYNRAVEDHAVEQTYPFKRVYTGIDNTVKRALPISVLRRIRELDLTRQPSLEYARDMFLLSFYMRGMSFIDMAFLRKTDLCNGTICYRRHKTGRLLIVRWTSEMQNILNRYNNAHSPYLLPVLSADSSRNRSVYRNTAYNINRGLKVIARLIGLKMPLTLYCARHSWASVARAEGVPLSVISEGMGHRTECTTRIYLASLDTSAVDRANNAILRLLY